MTRILDTMITAARKRARYFQTRNELMRLPLDLKLDLDIAEDQIDSIARRAVWG